MKSGYYFLLLRLITDGPTDKSSGLRTSLAQNLAKSWNELRQNKVIQESFFLTFQFSLMSFFSFLDFSQAQSSVNYGKSSGLLRLITDGPTSVNYGWSYG